MSTKKKKILLIPAVVITLIIITLIVVPFIIDVNKYKKTIETSLSDSLRMDVKVKGDMKVALFPNFRFSLKNIYVRNMSTDLFNANEVKVDLKLLPLILGEVKVKGVGLVNPTINIVKNKKGRFNFEIPGKSPSTAPPPLKNIYISKGNIIYLNEETKDKFMISGIDLVLKNISIDEKSGQTLVQKILFNGKLNIRKLKVKNYEVSNLAFNIKAKKGVFKLLSISKSNARNKGKNGITIDMTGNVPAFSIQYIESGLQVEKMLHKLSQKGILTGKINLTVNLSMKGKNLADSKKTLNGDVSITGENLVFHRFDIDKLISEFDKSKRFNLFDVGSYFFIGPFGPAITKGGEFVKMYSSLKKEKDSKIQKLICSWNINNGIADAKDVALSTEKNRIAMKGKLDFVNEQFVDVTLAVLNKKGCAVLIQKMHGSFSSPVINKANAIEVALGPVLGVLKKTKETLFGKKCTVFYTGSLEHPK